VGEELITELEEGSVEPVVRWVGRFPFRAEAADAVRLAERT
jgi:hypothetical protein